MKSGYAERRWSQEHSRLYHERSDEMRQYIRFEVTRENLRASLNDYLQFPRVAVDIGGGKGEDAAWLADLGSRHEAVLADIDSESLAIAKTQYGNILADVIHGDAKTVHQKYGSNYFELVFSHGVIQYSSDPAKKLSELANVLRPGGYLSLLTAGRIGKAGRYKDDISKFLLLEATGQYVNRLGALSKAYFPQEMLDMLSESGFETKDWFGVKVLPDTDKDNRLVSEVDALTVNRTFSMELEASRDPSRRPAGQMLHFIARKNT